MKIVLFANTDWYLYNFRLPLACHLRELGHEVVMLSPPGPYVARLQAAGFRALTVPMQRRSLNPVREAALLNEIRRVYAQEHPDLVHHFTIKCVVYGALAARMTGIPACVNAVTGLGHVFTSDGFKAHLLRPPVRALLRLAMNSPRSRLIVQNPDDQAAFLHVGLIEPRYVRLIRGSGVDTERFKPVTSGPTLNAVEISRHTGMDRRYPDCMDASEPRHPWNLGSGDPCRNDVKYLNSTALTLNLPPKKDRGNDPLTVLLASRLLWEKGIGEYVAAARQLRTEGIAAQFWLAGNPDPGNPASIPPEQLAEWQREGDITLLGQVDDMPSLLAQTDLAVLPSYREGTPRSLLEAAACGLPLVATDAPGCREVVQHGVNGLLVPVKDSIALANAIRQLCQDPATRQSMGHASRAKVLAEFDQQIVFERTLAVYDELMQ